MGCSSLLLSVLCVCTGTGLSYDRGASKVYTSVGGRVFLRCGDPQVAMETVGARWGFVAGGSCALAAPLGPASRRDVKADGTLVIRDVRPGDVGRYCCGAGSGPGTDLLLLSVSADPSDPAPEDIAVVTCELRCPAACGPYALTMNVSGRAELLSARGEPLQHVLSPGGAGRGRDFRCQLEVEGRVRATASLALQAQNRTDSGLRQSTWRNGGVGAGVPRAVVTLLLPPVALVLLG
ncbi:uncharacterized protein [Lepisosteus oculatus]|uniref:uncharacterized protein n=1 Tax=Lepisosteus oculatus TaxID=7918 RepID=UPI0035F528DD